MMKPPVSEAAPQIESARGDILHADTEAVVNPVNCAGVMGKGLALQFRRAYPDNYKLYRRVCHRKELTPGKMLIFTQPDHESPRYIINFPTKVHWNSSSRMQYIDQGLTALVEDIKQLGIRSIAIPPIGCGLGGLDWGKVKPRIEAAFAALPDVRVMLYENF